MDMYKLGMKLRNIGESAEEIYGELFPDSLQECDEAFRKG
jgi:hypothetical protein